MLLPRDDKIFTPTSSQTAAILPRDAKTFTSESQANNAYAKAWWVERTNKSPGGRNSVRVSPEKVPFLQSENQVGYEPMRSYRGARKGWAGSAYFSPAGIATLAPPVSNMAVSPSTPKLAPPMTPSRRDLMTPVRRSRSSKETIGVMGGRIRRVSKELAGKISSRVRRMSKELAAANDWHARRPSREPTIGRSAGGSDLFGPGRSTRADLIERPMSVREQRLQMRKESRVHAVL